MKLHHISESYEGLEDADEFGQDEFIIWVGGGRWGQFQEHGRYSDINAAIRDGEILSGPVTITRGYGETVWENDVDPMVIESVYDDLEDADSFEDTNYCHNCLGGAEEIARDGDQFHDCQECGTVYCSSCIPGGGIYNRSKEAGRQFHHVYEVKDGKIGPRVGGRYGNKVPFREKDFEISPNGIVFSCPACEDPALFPWEEPLEEGYEGLEDDDQFQDDQSCPGCGYEFVYSTRYAAPCHYCGETACQEDDPRFPECGGTVLDKETGEPVWSCKNCRAKLYDIHESYEGLEDADEFGSSCEKCGVVEDEMRTSEPLIHCGSCDCAICYSCVGSSDWQHNRRTDSFCPCCLGINESYEGLEDADQFDSGENLEEAEQIMMWMNNNGIHVKQDGDVVDIYDKHGVLEGFPDGRRFGDDIPVDRVVQQAPNGNWVEWLVLHINHAYALIWMLDEDPVDPFDQHKQWHTARTEQLEGGI